MKRAFPALILVACLPASPAMARNARSFEVPAQRLDTALIALGGQAQISIGGVDARLAIARGKAVRGTMSINRALQIMLRGTGFDFVQIDASTFRIVSVIPRAQPVAPQRPVEQAQALPPSAVQAMPEIIVTASKQQQGLSTYPGAAHVEVVGGAGMAENMGTSAFIARIPALTSTNLGPGRNKVFVRGIADSSFSGPTQSTVGLYLGDLRLTYNAPEPDLRLYDIDRVEVVEGPQGTLYGAGALGGVIRIMPNVPQTGSVHASASAGLSATQYGSAGYDLGGTINVPLVTDRIALRVVGYKQRDGGYIDNNFTGMHNTNASRIDGARAILRIRPGDGWTVDLGGVLQDIQTRDSQYAETSLPPRTQSARIAQPHDNDFRAASLAVDKNWGHLSLVSSTGLVAHDLGSVFDASGFQGRPGSLVYEEAEHISLLTHETRVSHNGNDGSSWVAGISLLHSTDRVERILSVPDASVHPMMLAALRNIKTEAALFGEATVPFAPRWSATFGGRFGWARTSGEFVGGAGGFEPHRTQLHFLPTAALSWKPRADWLGYVRYQTGFRSGGIAISGGAINSAQRFDSDTIHTAELGLRFGTGESRFSGSVAGFFTRWNAIQADLISTSGLPFTDNIGRGRVFGAEASLVWRPATHLALDGALFVNDSALVAPALGFEDANESRLPNIARAGGRASFVWTAPLADRRTFTLDGTLRYVGQSRLGTAPPLVLEQGETVQLNLAAALDAGSWKVTLDVSNLLNEGGNSFSYGNPFSVGLGKQITPLRPRTMRLGLHFGF